jgi:chondroitin AC lyase
MLAVLATIAALATPAPAIPSPDTDAAALIVGRQRALLLDGPVTSDIRFPAGDPATWVATLRDDGTWADIDYKSRNGGAWPTLEHLRRVRVIARAVASPRPGPDNDKNAAAALRALAHWAEARYQNPNWWQNDIGVPQVMRDIIVLLGPRLQGAALAGALDVLRQYKPQPPGFGANTVWTAELALMDGALSGDTAKVAAAAHVIAGEIVIGGAQGIQRDYSFLQHGARLQQFHYGRAFFTDTVRLAWILHGTPWAFPVEKIALLADYAVEGCAWMCRGTATVPGALDRAASRPGALANTADLRREWAMLADLLPARAREFHAFRENQDAAGEFSIFDSRFGRLSAFGLETIGSCRSVLVFGSARQRAIENRESKIENSLVPLLLTGFRAFPRADFAAYHCAGYSFFLKTVSTRTETTETHLRENKKGHKLNWGDHYLLRDGREYGALPPVWDWDLLPGVTSSTATTRIERKPFAGAAGDGASGVVAMDYEARGENGARVTARKFWAAHNGVIIVLIGALDATPSAGAAATPGAAPFRTALDQCLLRGPVTVADANGPALVTPPARREVRGARWLHHAGLLYMPVGGAAVSLTIGPVTGSWRDINENYSDTPVTVPVFLPVLEHGAAPQGASSGFAIQSCASAADAHALAARPAWRVLRNDAACQAVRFDDGALMAVFYERGEISDSGALFSAGQPCIALVSRGKLFVTDPLRAGKPLTLAVGTRRLAIDCPPDGCVSSPIPVNLP